MAHQWTPSVTDVKAQIPQRLNGAPFSPTTTPSEGQVAGHAEGVAHSLDAWIPDPITADLYDLASYVASLGAAADVERTFWPEQALDEGSQYNLLRARYEAEARILYKAVMGVWPDDVPGGTGIGPMSDPAYTFPEPKGGELGDEEFHPLGGLRW